MVMALNKRKTVQRMLAAAKAAVNVVTAVVAVTTDVVNAPKATTRALKKTARLTLKLLRQLQLQQQRQRQYSMQTAIRLLQPPAVSRVMSSASPESAAAATVMAATAANVVKVLNAAREAIGQSQPPKTMQHLLIQSQNRLWGSKNVDKLLRNW